MLMWNKMVSEDALI